MLLLWRWWTVCRRLLLVPRSFDDSTGLDSVVGSDIVSDIGLLLLVDVFVLFVVAMNKYARDGVIPSPSHFVLACRFVLLLQLLPLLAAAAAAAAGDHVMMILLLRYERCTITTLPPRRDSTHKITRSVQNQQFLLLLLMLLRPFRRCRFFLLYHASLYCSCSASAPAPTSSSHRSNVTIMVLLLLHQ